MATTSRTYMRKQNGLTLIELLVGLTILGVTYSLAAPSFQSMMSRQQSTTEVNELIVAINLARSESLKIGGTVSVQAADPSDAGNEFGPGWCVVAGTPGNCAGTVIRSFAGPQQAALDSEENVSAITFNSLGELTSASPRNLDFCMNATGNRRIHVALVGRAKSHRPDDIVVARRPTCT